MNGFSFFLWLLALVGISAAVLALVGHIVLTACTGGSL